MKTKDKMDVGKEVRILQPHEVVDILRVINKKSYIHEVPSILTQLINSNYNVALKAVEYAPSVYFKLNKYYRNDKKLMFKTIKSFQRQQRRFELSINENQSYKE